MTESKDNEVFVITKAESMGRIEEYLREHDVRNIKFFYADIPSVYKKLLNGFLYSGRLNVWHKGTFSIAKRLCKEYDIDIIHQITPVEFRSIGDYGRIPNVKFVCGPVGGGEYVPRALWAYTKGHRCVELLRAFINKYYKWKYKISGCLKRCDYLFYANNETRDFLGVTGGVLTEVGLNEVTTALAEKESGGKIVFLVAGRLIYRKGHRFLLDALKNVRTKNDYEVRIVGDGPEFECLEREVLMDESLKRHVRFKERIPFTEMQKEYDKADVFILPSLRETTGSVLLEAMSHGLPVIAINKFGSGLILNDGVGWMYKGRTKEEYIRSLSQSITYCVNHPEEVRRKAQNMLKLADTYTWREKVRRFDSVYRGLMKDEL